MQRHILPLPPDGSVMICSLLATHAINMRCRAVDDLYVMCEMEGSVYSTRTVVQHLDEATVDFRKVRAKRRLATAGS